MSTRRQSKKVNTSLAAREGKSSPMRDEVSDGACRDPRTPRNDSELCPANDCRDGAPTDHSKGTALARPLPRFAQVSRRASLCSRNPLKRQWVLWKTDYVNLDARQRILSDGPVEGSTPHHPDRKRVRGRLLAHLGLSTRQRCCRQTGAALNSLPACAEDGELAEHTSRCCRSRIERHGHRPDGPGIPCPGRQRTDRVPDPAARRPSRDSAGNMSSARAQESVHWEDGGR